MLASSPSGAPRSVLRRRDSYRAAIRGESMPTDPIHKGHSRRPSRRAVLGVLGAAAVASPVVLAHGFADAAQSFATPDAPNLGVPTIMAPTQVWTPNIASQGTGIFEGLEEDRAHSHPGVDHIFSKGDEIRFEIHKVDRDS